MRSRILFLRAGGRPSRVSGLTLCLALAAVLALPAAPGWPQGSDHPRPIVSEIVSPDSLRSRSFTGVIEAEQKVTLAFQTAGRVAALPLTVGDRVTRGQVLAELDQVTLQDDVDTAQAALLSARAAEAAASQALTRTQALAQRGVASTQALQSARRAADTATAQASAAAANLNRARDAAGFSRLTAPTDGVVLAIAAQPGSVVTAGAPILTLALGTGREAVLDIPSDYISVLTPGRQFTLRARVPTAPALTGTLRLIEPLAGTATRSSRIRVSLPGATGAWPIGGLVRAELAGGAAMVITLPQTAIDGTPGQPAVWTAGPGRAAHLVPVTLGPRLGPRVVITQGLALGDEVVVRGVHSLTEGQILGAREE